MKFSKRNLANAKKNNAKRKAGKPAQSKYATKGPAFEYDSKKPQCLSYRDR